MIPTPPIKTVTLQDVFDYLDNALIGFETGLSRVLLNF